MKRLLFLFASLWAHVWHCASEDRRETRLHFGPPLFVYGKLAEDLETLKGFAAAGKPVVIEEIFLLQCGMPEFARFIEASRAHTRASDELGP